MQIDPFLLPYKNSSINRSKSFKVNLDTESCNSFEHIGIGGNLQKTTPMTQALRSTIDKSDLMKLQIFRMAKNSVNRTKGKPTDWERISPNLHHTRGLISKFYKEHKKIETNNPNNPIKNEYREKQNSQHENHKLPGNI
jgi:tRNA 2-selenouridine synthase SelU